MSTTGTAGAPATTLAPFGVRSFRFQWPADLATSWAFEMETLILGWYVMESTGSVTLLTLFGALLWMGTLVSPMFGVGGDRIGHRNLLCMMRLSYTALAATLMALAFLDLLSPALVLGAAAIAGMVRPSDLVMRYALIGQTMPPPFVVGAMSIMRTTSDSARIIGALAGAGLVAALGMGRAYVVVTALYMTGLLLTLGVAPRPATDAGSQPAQRSSPWRDLRDGLGYVWSAPHLIAAISLAFLVNLTAYPIVLGLLPYVAREIYGTDQTGLGYMSAGFAFGGLIGSIGLSRFGGTIRAARMMMIFAVGWYAMMLVFAYMPGIASGVAALIAAGCAQSLSLVPLSAILVRNTDPVFRARVAGIRMLAIYGLPVGLLVAGPLIARFGFPAIATAYCAIGVAFTCLIAMRWRAHVWHAGAPANSR